MPGVGLSIPEVALRGRPVDPDAVALVARMSVAPDIARTGLIHALVRALKDGGVWAKLDLLYVLAAHDAQAARLNWLGSGFALTAVNAPAFTTDRGYAGDGATSYLDTGWDPASNGGRYGQDGATIAGWSRTPAQASGYWIGAAGGLNAAIRPRDTSDAFAFLVNQGVAATVASSDGSGWFAASRGGSAAVQGYRNGAAVGSAGTMASNAVPGIDFAIGKARGSFNAAQCAACAVGGSLNAGEQLALYRALAAYLAAVGAA